MTNPVSGNVFDLELDVGVDFGIPLSVAIDYKDPNGNTGVWPASFSGTTVTATLGPDDTPYPGTWEVQAYVVDALGNGRHGEPVKITIEKKVRGASDSH